jgi:anti-anti-sigma factor
MVPPFSGPSLEVVHPHPDHTILRFPGCEALDEEKALAVGRKLSLLPDDLARSNVVLDLGGVCYMTSTALGTLVGFNRRVRDAGGRFALANVGASIQEILAVTRLNKLLEVWPA